VKLHAIRQVREYLHDRIDELVTTTELARVAAVSRFQLTRQFQRAFGLPLHAYHLQIDLCVKPWSAVARASLQFPRTVADK
jgi:AraC-like DNA-binding protein